MQRLMLIDDEINVLRALYRLLSAQFPSDELQVEMFVDPREALLWAEAHNFDVAIADYHMPRMDGVTLLEQLRERRPDTVRFILSGSSDRSVLVDAINRAKIYRFIDKPWDDAELVAAVREALRLNARIERPEQA